MASFSLIGLGLSRGENSYRPMTGLHILRQFSGLFQAEARKKKEPVGGTPRHVCRNFRAKNRRADLPVFNIKQNLARTLDPTLKPSILQETTCVVHV